MSKIQKRNGVKKLTQKQRVQKRLMQKGRTMVEMLGVLAVIGVLTITGIVGMQYAMQVHKENETLNAFSVATAGARTANLMQNYIYSCDEIPCVVDPKQVISTKYEMTDKDFITAVNAPVRVRIEDTNGYTVRIRGISKEVCESIKSGFWGETCAGIDGSGQDKRYRSDNCTALKSLNCDQFANAKEGFSRRSALQEEIESEHIQVSSYSEAKNYSALVLYYGEPAGDNDPVVNYEREPDPDVTPDPGEEDNDVAHRVEEVLDECTSQGGEWVGQACCSGSLNVLTGKEDRTNCCNGNVPKVGADDGTCCQLNWHTWKNSTCCDGPKDMNGNVVAACCDGYLVGSTCCIGSKNAETGQDDSACCEKGEMVNGICCEGLTNTQTGQKDETCCKGDWKDGICCEGSKDVETGNVVETCCKGEWKNGICCEGSKNAATGTVIEACCKGDWNNGVCCNGSKDFETGNVVAACRTGGEVKEGVCCKGFKDADTEEVVEACCTGEWRDGVCCNGLKNVETNSVVKECCTGEYEWREEDGVGVCCKGDYDATGEINLKCVRCDTFGNDLISEVATEYCCQKDFGDQDGKWIWINGLEGVSGVCCKTGTSANLSSHGVPAKECCEAAGGDWKGSWCCAAWGKKDAGSGGMCRR